MQWARTKYEFPITKQQIIKRIRRSDILLYKIVLDHEMIGTIEIMRETKEEGIIGGFLISSSMRGKGYGTIFLKAMIHIAFYEIHLKRLDSEVMSNLARRYARLKCMKS